MVTAAGAIEGLRLTRAMPLRAEGNRGVMAWEFDRTTAAMKQVNLDHTASWPEGKALQLIPCAAGRTPSYHHPAAPDLIRGLMVWG